jgi:hypothetical protein
MCLQREWAQARETYINKKNAGLINQIMETLMEHCGWMNAGGTMVEIQVGCNAVQSRESFQSDLHSSSLGTAVHYSAVQCSAVQCSLVQSSAVQVSKQLLVPGQFMSALCVLVDIPKF